MEIDTDQLSPNSMCAQLATYHSTVQKLYDQNQRNTEILGRLETVVTEKESEISRLRSLETEKDLRLEAQQRDFHDQLNAEQNTRQEITNTLQELCNELEQIRAD